MAFMPSGKQYLLMKKQLISCFNLSDCVCKESMNRLIPFIVELSYVVWSNWFIASSIWAMPLLLFICRNRNIVDHFIGISVCLKYLPYYRLRQQQAENTDLFFFALN